MANPNIVAVTSIYGNTAYVIPSTTSATTSWTHNGTTALTGTKTITAPSYSKIYLVDNTTATYGVTFKASGQTGVTIAAGEKAFVYFNGTDYVKTASSTGGVSTISFGSTGLTPSTATSGAVSVAGTLAIANGGTGATTATTALNNLGGASTGKAIAMAIVFG